MLVGRIQELAVMMLTIAALSIIVRNATGFSTAVTSVSNAWRLSLRELVSPVTR